MSVAKGIENDSLRRPSEILGETCGADASRLACLSGPTIASELARHLPATMVAASNDASTASRVQQAFGTPWLRVYSNDDLVGVEVAGAVKNVIALAAGLVDGLELGSNAKSALLARGLAEIVRLGIALDARRETFFGIAGVGDLATTCFSPEGRNRTCGEALGRGMSLERHLAESECVVEGVPTTRSITALAKRLDVEVPIIASSRGSSSRDSIRERRSAN